MANCVYLKETKHLNYLLRSVCIVTRIPCDEKPSSASTTNPFFLLLEWMYTIMFYVFSCLVFFDLIYTQNDIPKRYTDDPSMDSFNRMLILLLSVCIVLISPLAAIKANENREKYIQLWREYQMDYEQYTESKLTLDSSNFVIALAVGGTIVTALELGANCALTSQSAPVYVYAYWLIYFYTNFTAVLWAVDCRLLAKASEKLLDNFLTTTSDKTGRTTTRSLELRLFRYAKLWRKLSDMTGGLTDTGRGMYELNFAVQSVIVVQAVYGIVALYADRQQQSASQQHPDNVICFPTAAWSVVNLVVLCEAAYSVTTQYLGVAISYIIVLVQFKIGTS